MRHRLPFGHLLTYKNLIKTVISFSVFVALYPVAAFYTGNAFFGEIKPLYNLTFARFFYTIATHPVTPVLTPWSAHYQLARTYFIEGDIFSSLDEAQEELSLNPGNYVSYYLIGLDYGYLGMPYQGINAFDHYIQGNPTSWAGRNDKAWLQFRIGDIDGAIATVEPVMQFYPYTPWIQNTYCTLLLNTDRKKQAQEVCEHAKELIAKLTPEAWGQAYPGNDPSIYPYGLEAMKRSSERNAELSKNLDR
jgi:tetratricopeptide (TPR) repeat protein